MGSFKEVAAITVIASCITFLLLAFFLMSVVFMDRLSGTAYYVRLKSLSYNVFGDSEITDKVAYLCFREKDTSFERAKCVNLFFKAFYVYKGNVSMSSPDSILLGGGDCKASSAWYDYVFDRLNITHWLSPVPEHIFVKAYVDDGDYFFECGFDEGIMDCKRREL